MQERWSALEADAAAAREAVAEATAAAGKAEADLAALSTAYNDLEEHAFRMEEQLKQQQEEVRGRRRGRAGAGEAKGGEGVFGVKVVGYNVASPTFYCRFVQGW
jgi:hypothetical protein